jgi:hypothetical protein
MVRSVSIVGLGQTMASYFYAYMGELKPPTTHTWCINRLALLMPWADMCIAMDDRRWLLNAKQFRGAARAIDNTDMPIMTAEVYPEFPASIEYPLKWVCDRVPARTVLKNSINYALALAIARRYKEVIMWGCDFGSPDSAETIVAFKETSPHWRAFYTDEGFTQYSEPGMEENAFLLGIAEERGIKVIFPQGSTTLSRHRPHFYYGYMDPEVEDGILET